MASRSEKDKQKAQQERYQAILSALLRDEDNKYCVDCDAKGTVMYIPYLTNPVLIRPRFTVAKDR
jgi:hypothetical protein